MAADEPRIHIGRADKSSFAFGDNARAETHNSGSTGRDEATEELLNAVRELRADLARVQHSPQTEQLDEALAETEGEITRTGVAGEGRLQRLRVALTDAQNIVTLFASAAAVAGLLGM
jgi:uncharacterized protein YlxW (UPF0749 family)